MYIERTPGQINARDAHIWWNSAFGVVRVIAADEEQTAALSREGYTYGAGASYGRWQDYDDEQRVREMTELAVKLMVEGYDPGMVVREFTKVRQFLHRGAESLSMCRAITHVIEGKADENTEHFRSRFLSD
jgi:hypothetical protein